MGRKVGGKPNDVRLAARAPPARVALWPEEWARHDPWSMKGGLPQHRPPNQKKKRARLEADCGGPGTLAARKSVQELLARCLPEGSRAQLSTDEHKDSPRAIAQLAGHSRGRLGRGEGESGGVLH
jgi:hypothetical protein